ncbi:hypothetical protein IFM89_023108 [Coptis chinensis]|uniref:VOC domain-containing protein n=1 Tax=Coptis chinensis TaxID=261450 RepID=A0A835LSN8_9MAGN|nr:hypothetical protein IFM89_023108 [Coptis chinensis]
MAQESVETVSVDLHNGENGNGNKVVVTGVTKSVSFFGLKPQVFVEAPKASDAVQFYKTVFGAEELKRDIHPKRKADHELPLILSAELKLGSSVFIVSDSSDESSTALVKSGGYSFCLETNDVETAVANAVKAGGAVVEAEIADGENTCCGKKVKDPYGVIWSICSGSKVVADVVA